MLRSESVQAPNEAKADAWPENTLLGPSEAEPNLSPASRDRRPTCADGFCLQARKRLFAEVRQWLAKSGSAPVDLLVPPRSDVTVEMRHMLLPVYELSR